MRNVKLYHFTAWPDHGVPKFATGLLGFMKRVNRELLENAGPMVVHCRFTLINQRLLSSIFSQCWSWTYGHVYRD